MRLNVFNGGLHLRPAPHLIKTNESRVFTNVDNSKGILTPIKDKVSAVTGASQFSFFYVEEQEWQFSETPTDWLEFQKRLYYSDRLTEPKKIVNGVTSRWGIAPPEGSITVTEVAQLPSNPGFSGEIQYCVTYYNSSTGVESGPLFTDSTDTAAVVYYVTLSDIPVSSDSQVDKKRIYRIGQSYTEFVLVDTIDNAITTYDDTTLDIDVVGTLLTTAISKPAPTGLQFITTAYAMIFGALGSQLRYTPIAQPESWPDLYFIDFPMPVTGISLTSNGVLVHTMYKTYIVTGTGPSTLSQQIFSETQGCINGDSCVSVAGNALWVSTDGICLSQGSDVKVITKPKLGKTTFDSVIAVVHDQEYHLQLTDGTVFTHDFDDNIIKYSKFGTTGLVVAEDTLYGFSDGTLFELKASNANLELDYLSPEFVGTTYTKTKAYKSIYVTSSDSIKASVYVEGSLVLEQSFSGSKRINEIKLPSSVARGLLIQIGFKGTGTVYEVVIDEGDTNV